MSEPITTAQEALAELSRFRMQLKQRGEIAAAHAAARCINLLRARMGAKRERAQKAQAD